MSVKEMRGLRRLNLVVVVIDVIQAILILSLANNVKLPVTGSYLSFSKAMPSEVPMNRTIFEMPLVWLVVSFLLVSAVAHLLILTTFKKRYATDLKKGLNYIRWITYALAGGSMIVAIAMTTGIYDIGSLAMMYGLTAFLCLMGLVTEKYNQDRQKVSYLPYVVGVSAGIVPWLVLGYYLHFSAQQVGSAPAYVYIVFVSLFVIFCSFAFNMLLHFRQFGRWKNYFYAEKIYMWLGIVAKTALAWQLYVGILR